MFPLLPIRRGISRPHRYFSSQSDRARLSERLWDTLVPERNWTPLTPQFWILLVATVSLYTYNRLHPKEDNVLPSEDKKRSEALLRLKSG
ncbi:hypothetical protein BBOV_III002080 [Babesia bovis T2Bo]|uniref:hypothetical protein n=1 Tax=Babesia bovis T2Bo TaxID=484906 RepID=UPI001C34809E|nr:hypothetical protein BBOV_III002080 [Babesia bovis T2Bo]EDO07775.2 hypothetical protein BBOV_III002080 [Babesia bovis T2Bo]